MTVIKRYSNRKLYDLQSRSYVTLDELGERIRQGEEIKVIDHDTNADITSGTLAQIISDQNKRGTTALSQDSLERLIRAGTNTITDLGDALRSLLDPISEIEDEIKRRLEILVAEGQLAAEEGHQLAVMLLDPRLRPVNRPTETDRPSEIADLLREVEELEKQVSDLEQRKKAP